MSNPHWMVEYFRFKARAEGNCRVSRCFQKAVVSVDIAVH
jgi:hypothetical protein